MRDRHRWPVRWPWPALAAILAVPSACSEGPDAVTAETAAVTLRDSAGVEIVEIPQGAWDLVPIWTLAAQPTVTIGEVEGDAEYLFGSIAAATRFPDGRIGVFDRGSREFRVFSPDGVHLLTVGGPGEGPGEFSDPRGYRRTGPTEFTVFDAGTSRLTTFGIDTGQQRTVRTVFRDCELPVPAPRVRRCLFAGMMADGSILASAEGDRLGSVGGTERVRFTEASLFVVTDSIRWVDSFPMGPQDFILDNRSEPWMRNALFHPTTVVSVGSPGFVTSDSHEVALRGYDTDGRLFRIVRIESPTRPVTEVDIEEVRALIDAVESPAAGMDTYLERFEPGALLPNVESLFLDDFGRTWVLEFRVSFWGDRVEEWRWRILDSSGRPAGQIDLRGPRDLFEIGEDYALVRLTDELGVQSVAQYGLNTGG